jgi:molybdenum cofactor cytidylyltransferase
VAKGGGLTILIPAAGSSARMRGADKLLEPVADGVPLLRHQALKALATGHPVIITLRAPDPARAAALAGLPLSLSLPLSLRPVADAATGLSASLRAMAGLDSALMILPADMPDITVEDLQTLIAAFDQAPATIHRATSATGQPGHPVILPAALLPELHGLSGDEGARSLLQRHPVLPVPLPFAHATTDLDTPEDWALWRSRLPPDRG